MNNTNIRTAHDLAMLRALPLEVKILKTQQRIREWYDHWCGEVYVSFSGGKDSTVLKHIVDSMYDDVPALFIDTGLEYPELRRFAKEQKNVVVLRPEMRFDEVLKTHGYPIISKEVSQQIHEVRRSSELHHIPPRETRPYNRKFNPESDYCKKNPSYCMKKWEHLVDSGFKTSHMCCTVMKKKPAKKYEKETGRKPMIGTLTEESRLRRTQWLLHGCNAFEKDRPVSTPLSFWTEQDILRYLKEFEIPYASVYGDIVEENGVLKTTGADRTGCVFCAFGEHLQKSQTKYQTLQHTHPRLYDYCINGGEYVDGVWQPSKDGLGFGKVLDYIGVPYK